MNHWKNFLLTSIAVVLFSGCASKPPTGPQATPTPTPIPTPFPYKASISCFDPWAVGVSPGAGFVFVADFPGNEVQVLGPYSLGTTWTSYSGSAFGDIASIAVGADGSVYMADGTGNNVDVFSSFGDPVTSWSGYGIIPFNAPYSLSLAPNGNVFVADQFNSKVEVFTPQGDPVTEWSVPGYPAQVAVSPLAPYNVYINDFVQHTIQEYSAGGSPITQWGSAEVSSGIGMGQFGGVEGITVGPNGNVFVADGIGSCQNGTSQCDDYFVQEFSPNGTFLTQWGGQGAGHSQFVGTPGELTFDTNGDLYVADPDGHRVEVFGP